MPHQTGRRASLLQVNQAYFPACLKHRLSPCDLFDPIVGTLYQNIGKEALDEGRGGVIVEHGYRVHAAESRDYTGSIGLRLQGPARAFQPPGGSIGVHPDHEAIPEAARRFERCDVPAVQQIEYAVAEHQPEVPRTAETLDQNRHRENSSLRIARR